MQNGTVSAQAYIERGQFQQAITVCEDMELFMPQSAEYARCMTIQMALYFVTGDLCNARHFWRRLHPTVKTEGSEISMLWAGGRALWGKDMGEISAAFRRQWSPEIQPLIEMLLDKLKNDQIALIGKAYSVIPLKQVATMLAVDEQEAARCCASCGWPIDSATGMVSPKPLVAVGKTIGSADERAQLAKLMDYVRLLEKQRRPDILK